MPSTVTIVAGQRTASFDFTAGSSEVMGVAVNATAQAGALVATPAIVDVQLAHGTLMFSEYLEGSSNNKALELYNGTAAEVDLTQCEVQLYSNGASSPSATLALTGDLQPGSTFVLCNTSASAGILAVCNLRNSSVVNFNGDDSVALVCGGNNVDVIGQIGTDPGAEWVANGVSTLNKTLRRKCSVVSGDPDGSNAFDPSAEWDTQAQDTIDGLGSRNCN
ncbi:MAG: lamin tail domain-containing protein [Deltaproteobacteria bacterium]|nr:lamin tail domain-containing protein [Deltaproteobacteria bacterium]